jgi:hypothetical protein
MLYRTSYESLPTTAAKHRFLQTSSQLLQNFVWKRRNMYLFAHKPTICKYRSKKYCKDKDVDACAIKLNLSSNRLCIITIYRVPTGNIDAFIIKFDTVLRNLYTSKQECIICGDININYLPDS